MKEENRFERQTVLDLYSMMRWGKNKQTNKQSKVRTEFLTL